MKIIIGILVFSIIIIIHELGHFILAKKNNILVKEFCIGFGPTIVGFTKGETKYSIKLLPLGGACMMLGEDDEDGEFDNDPRSFGAQSVAARISVVLAGPVFNLILAFLLSLIVMGTVGYDAPIVKTLTENGPAQAAGIKPGDEILTINGGAVTLFREIDNASVFIRGNEIDVTYKRDGEVLSTHIVGNVLEGSNQVDYGFGRGVGRVKTDFWGTIKYSFNEVRFWIDTTVKSLWTLITGRASFNDMQGPVGIVKAIGNTYDRSKRDGIFYVFINMVNIAILLTANLGIMNLIPIPALDGGRFVFLVIEGIRRKRFNPKIETAINMVSFVALLGLMVVIMFNDIRKIIFP
ncbi:MAG: PDZ domain-containing protein [Lachnospiraceae bacterium]|nr:PDZ domain-containing protein [Lachnospiraceae bacterium]